MGYMLVMSECFGCGNIFTYHADYVPSIRHNGVREPICKECVYRVNPMREANGLPAIVPHPLAYEAQESV